MTKVRRLKYILNQTDSECDVHIKLRLPNGQEIKYPLQHTYIVDVELGVIELVLEVGKEN